MPLPIGSWKLNSTYLSKASLDQLVALGKMTSLEHRRHVVDPTLLGLHEVRAAHALLRCGFPPWACTRRRGACPSARPLLRSAVTSMTIQGEDSCPSLLCHSLNRCSPTACAAWPPTATTPRCWASATQR